MQIRKKEYIHILILLMGSFLCAMAGRLYICLVKQGQFDKISSICVYILKDYRTYIIALLLWVMGYIFWKQKERIVEFLYKYRYVFAFSLFFFCVVLELNGSSIGVWSEKYGVEDNDLLLGRSRYIRSDEYAVWTPMLLSQYENVSGTFPYFSDTVRGCTTDVFLEYGEPVKSIAMIFRPFEIGFLFLSPGKGMAFFWCGRLIALFMVSFEMGMLITNKKKKLSVLFACLIAFAPVVQWWFAINGLVEMLICLQLSIIMFWKYMNTEKYWERLLYVTMIMICAGTYVLTMYPSWMVPFAWILVGLIIWVLLENWKHCKMKWYDWLTIAAELSILGGILAMVFTKSWDTVKSIMGTVYPGSRFETGGGLWKDLFSYMANIMTVITEQGTSMNACESARFIDFFPICYIFPVIVLFIEKNRDKFIVILSVVSLMLGIYCTIGFPGWLAKITLLSNSQAGRAIIAFEFCNLFLLLRCMAITKMRFKRWVFALIAMGAGCIGIAVCQSMNQELFQIGVSVFLLVLFVLLFYAVMQGGKNSTICIGGLICVTIVSGGLVNPVRKGVDNVYDIPMVQSIQEVHKQDEEALWVIEGGFPETNLGIIAGAATINSTNIYPNLERWHILDSNGEYEDVYNRYAHITVDIEENGETYFEEGIAPDVFTLHITVDDLSKLGVSYISTTNDLSLAESEKMKLDFVSEYEGCRVYKLIEK